MKNGDPEAAANSISMNKSLGANYGVIRNHLAIPNNLAIRNCYAISNKHPNTSYQYAITNTNVGAN